MGCYTVKGKEKDCGGSFPQAARTAPPPPLIHSPGQHSINGLLSRGQKATGAGPRKEEEEEEEEEEGREEEERMCVCVHVCKALRMFPLRKTGDR